MCCCMASTQSKCNRFVACIWSFDLRSVPAAAINLKLRETKNYACISDFVRSQPTDQCAVEYIISSAEFPETCQLLPSRLVNLIVELNKLREQNSCFQKFGKNRWLDVIDVQVKNYRFLIRFDIFRVQWVFGNIRMLRTCAVLFILSQTATMTFQWFCEFSLLTRTHARTHTKTTSLHALYRRKKLVCK